MWPIELVLVHQHVPDADIPDRDTEAELSPLGHLVHPGDAIIAWPPNRNPPVRFLAEQCCRCRRLRTFATCDAFAGAIPRAIAQGRHDHREPFAGDKGKLFEPNGDDDRFAELVLDWLTGADAPVTG